MRISGLRNCVLASSKFSFRTHFTYSGANFIGSMSVQADQVGHETVRAWRAGRQLAPQPQPDVDPAALPHFRLDQRTGLHPAVEVERIARLYEVHVPLVAVPEEIQPALLHPSRPGLRPE